MKQKYKYEIDTTLDHKPNRPLYRLKTTKAGKEITKVVGINALRSMYCDGAICGFIPEYLKVKLGAPRRKIRSDKKGYVPTNEAVAPNWNLKDFVIAQPKWNLPDEFKVELTGKAYIFEKDGRWCVMMPDGTLDEDTYPDKEWAQSEADSLNKVVDNLKE